MRTILALVIIATLSGCWLLEPQYVKLEPAQEAAIVDAVGELSESNLEAWVAEATKRIDAQVVRVVDTAQGVILELSPPADEAAGAAAESLIDEIVKNPTPAGIAAGAAAAVIVALRIFGRRKTLEVK